MTVTPWGVWLEPTVPAVRLVEMAVAAEEAGAEVCLIADEGNGRDVWVTLGAIATATEKIVVGPGVTNPFTRHPVTTATAVATLAEMAPGRVWAGLGAGAPSTLAPIGFEAERPLPALRESMATAQQLLDGESSGRAFLGWFEGHVPLVVGGRGLTPAALAGLAAPVVGHVRRHGDRVGAGAGAGARVCVCARACARVCCVFLRAFNHLAIGTRAVCSCQPPLPACETPKLAGHERGRGDATMRGVEALRGCRGAGRTGTGRTGTG